VTFAVLGKILVFLDYSHSGDVSSNIARVMDVCPHVPV